MRFSRLVFLVLIVFAIVAPIKLFVAEPIYITSASMEPTLKKGVHLVLDKLTYRFRKPERGEIISFRSPVGEPHDSVKRVIAVEGDMVEMRDKLVFVNEKQLYEPYVKYSRQDERLAGDTFVPLFVPDNHLFVLGDNRDESRDSSVWKDAETGERIYFIALSRVTGKVRGLYRKEFPTFD